MDWGKVGTADWNQSSPETVGSTGHALDDTQNYAPSTEEDQSSMLDYVLVLVRYVRCHLLYLLNASTNYHDSERVVAIFWCVYSVTPIHTLSALES